MTRLKKWKRSSVDIISALVTASGLVLAWADDVKALKLVPDSWTHNWGVVLAIAMLIRTVGHGLITHLEPTTSGHARSNSKPNLRPQAHSHPNADPATKPHARPGRPHSDSIANTNPNTNTAVPDSTS